MDNSCIEMFTRMTLRHEIWRQRSRKEELPKTLEDQIELGEEGLAQEDEYLLDINLDDADILTHLQKIRLFDYWHCEQQGQCISVEGIMGQTKQHFYCLPA